MRAPFDSSGLSVSQCLVICEGVVADTHPMVMHPRMILALPVPVMRGIVSDV